MWRLAAAADDLAVLGMFQALYREDPDDPCVAFHYRRLQEGETGTLIEMHEK